MNLASAFSKINVDEKEEDKLYKDSVFKQNQKQPAQKYIEEVRKLELGYRKSQDVGQQDTSAFDQSRMSVSSRNSMFLQRLKRSQTERKVVHGHHHVDFSNENAQPKSILTSAKSGSILKNKIKPELH